uniref:DNA repair protein SWI5 homolog n=1 Tax=Strigamia maritima TaxID=126957 RepID=T1IY55_STRMM
MDGNQNHLKFYRGAGSMQHPFSPPRQKQSAVELKQARGLSSNYKFYHCASHLYKHGGLEAVKRNFAKIRAEYSRVKMNRKSTPSSTRYRSAFKSPILRPASSNTSVVVTKDQMQREIQELMEKVKALDNEIAELEEEGCKEEELEVHIDKLHRYNEIKDVAQMVMGRIAVLDGVTTKDVHEKYGIGSKD